MNHIVDEDGDVNRYLKFRRSTINISLNNWAANPPKLLNHLNPYWFDPASGNLLFIDKMADNQRVPLGYNVQGNYLMNRAARLGKSNND